MARLISILVIASLCSTTISQKLWRDDGKCGPKNPLADGTPGQCDPQGDGPKKGPCCSKTGFCGNTDKHCCDGCKDYSKVEPKLEKKKAVAKAAPVLFKEEVTKNECGKEPSTGAVRQIGDSWSDGCNSCTCLKDLKPACTKKLCGPKPEEVTSSERAEVKVGSATVVGEKVREGEHSYFVFKGIPYAQPPVGRLRFRAPVPANKLEGTVDATKFGSKCLQYDDLDSGQLKGSEDCLYLNVYLPTERSASDKLPVFFWIHGGGFNIGSGDQYDPSKLVQEG